MTDPPCCPPVVPSTMAPPSSHLPQKAFDEWEEKIRRKSAGDWFRLGIDHMERLLSWKPSRTSVGNILSSSSIHSSPPIGLPPWLQPSRDLIVLAEAVALSNPPISTLIMASRHRKTTRAAKACAAKCNKLLILDSSNSSSVESMSPKRRRAKVPSGFNKNLHNQGVPIQKRNRTNPLPTPRSQSKLTLMWSPRPLLLEKMMRSKCLTIWI